MNSCMYACEYVSKSVAAQSATVLEAVFSQAYSVPEQEALVQRSFSGLRLEKYGSAQTDP